MDYKKIKKFFKDFYSKPYCWTEDDPRYKGFIKKFVYEYYNTNGLNPIGIKIKRYSLKKEYKEYKEYLKRKIKVSVLFWDIFRFTCVFIYGFTFVWMAMVLNVNQYSEYTIEFDPSWSWYYIDIEMLNSGLIIGGFFLYLVLRKFFKIIGTIFKSIEDEEIKDIEKRKKELRKKLIKKYKKELYEEKKDED